MNLARALSIVAALAGASAGIASHAQVAPSRMLIAHRGASAYAPEHTRAAYELAIAQGADYVEQDLAITRDGILICLHDESLERTTNVEQVFPGRFTTDSASGAKRWMAIDFTLAEIKRLDAGSWFDPKFAGERIPTWQETVELVGDRAGLYPELKSPGLYRSRNVDMVALVVADLKRRGFDRPSSSPRPRLILQSFDPEAVRALRTLLPEVPRVLLVDPRDAGRWLSEAGLREVKAFADGIGPHKAILYARPELVRAAQGIGLSVTPYTFRSREPGRFPDVRAEMTYFLNELGVNALFTDNPDRFPRQP